MADEGNELGPISYLIVEFPGNQMTGGGLAVLLDLVERGTIRILDLCFVMREADGRMRLAELGDLDGDGSLDLAVFEGASSGVIDEDDISEASAAIQPGSAAAILVFENRWAAPFTRELRRSGAELVAAGYIPQDALVAALDAIEAKV